MTALLALGKSICRPVHLGRLLHDAAGRSYRLESDRVHLRAAVDWLACGQDICPGGGVSAGYSLPNARWHAAEPSATCHAITAFLAAARLLDDPTLIDRGRRAGTWILRDLPANPEDDSRVGSRDILAPAIIASCIELYETTGDAQFLAAAVDIARPAAGPATRQPPENQTDILAQRQRALSASAQFRLLGHTGADDLRTSAEQLIDDLAGASQPNGWPTDELSENGNSRHVPAYQLGMTLDALFPCLPHLTGLRRERTERLLFAAAERTMVRFELNKPRPEALPRHLPATLNSRWKSAGRFSCNTGTAYLADVWLQAFGQCHDARFVNAALKAIDHLKAQQSLRTRVAGMSGAVPGARPTWTAAFTSSFPTRATAQTVTAIVRQEEIMQELGSP